MPKTETESLVRLAATAALLTAAVACSSDGFDSAAINRPVDRPASEPGAIPATTSAQSVDGTGAQPADSVAAPIPDTVTPVTEAPSTAAPAVGAVDPQAQPTEVQPTEVQPTPPMAEPAGMMQPQPPVVGEVPIPINNPGSPASMTPLSQGCADIGGSGKTIEVNDEDELSDALASAAAGDTIVIKADLDDTLSVRDLKFDARNPLWIVGDGVSVENASIRNSVGVSIGGIRFTSNDASTLLKVENSQNIQIVRNTFDHTGVQSGQTSIVTSQATDSVEIGCNAFQNMDFANAASGSFIKTQWDEPALTKNLHIHHNHFKGITPVPNDGGFKGDSDREAIAFGVADTQDIVTSHIVEFNLFEDCDGENEIITVKTSGNSIRFNTFLNSLGSVSVRFGANTDVYGNFFLANEDNQNAFPNDTGGIRVYGTGHRIFNNYFEGLTGESWRVPINVDGGDTSDSTGGNRHERSTNVLVVNNTLVNCTHGIGVGTHYNLDAKDTVFANNLFVNLENPMFDIGNQSGSTFFANMGIGSPVGLALEAAQLMETDPMLVQGGGVFRLSDTSPARNAANTQFAFVQDDIEGNARQMPDIGADEFTAESPSRRLLSAADVGPASPVLQNP